MRSGLAVMGAATGFACSAAMDQLEQIERDAQPFIDVPNAAVTVLELR